MSTIRLPRLLCDGCKRYTFRPDWAETEEVPREVLLSEAREAGWVRDADGRDLCPACVYPIPARTIEDSYRDELALARAVNHA